MKTPYEDLLTQHPKFQEYVNFFDSSAKPECQGCSYLLSFELGFALDVLQAAVRLNRRGTKIKSVDPQIEEEVLLAKQKEFTTIAQQCTGPTVVENSHMVAQADFIRAGNPEKNAEQIEALITRLVLPLSAACNLQEKAIDS